MKESGFYENIGSYLYIILMLTAGVFGLLLAFKKIDLSKGKVEDKEKWEKWYKDHGKFVKIFSIALIVVSVFQLVIQLLGK